MDIADGMISWSAPNHFMKEVEVLGTFEVWTTVSLTKKGLVTI